MWKRRVSYHAINTMISIMCDINPATPTAAAVTDDAVLMTCMCNVPFIFRSDTSDMIPMLRHILRSDYRCIRTYVPYRHIGLAHDIYI